MTTQNPIDPKALDGLAVAPPDPDQAGADSGEGEGGSGQHPHQQAGQDLSIAERLARDPCCTEAQLDRGLDESMDASDPPSITQPGKSEPAPSSGYDEAAERARQRDA